MDLVNEILAEKNLIIAARDNEIQNLQNQLAKANKSVKKKKTETLGANTKSLQEVEAILTDLDAERKKCAMMQENYEKVCSEKNDLALKFDDLAFKIGEALEATKEKNGDMIHVDLIEPVYVLYKKKATMLKEAKEMIADLCSQQKPTELKRGSNAVFEVMQSDTNARMLNELTVDEQKRTLFIGGLSESIVYDDVLQYATQFGKVQQISTPKSGGTSKAFIMYADAMPSRVHLGPKNVIKGSTCNVQRFHQSYIGNPRKFYNRHLLKDTETFTPQKENDKGLNSSKFTRKNKLTEAEQECSLFVGKLAGANSSMVKKYFAQFGTIVDATVFGCSFGYVMFKSMAEAESVPLGKQHCINGKIVDVKRYQIEYVNQHTNKSSTASFVCTVCMLESEENCRHVFNPCGHGSCDSCARELKYCHACKNKIESISNQF